jgi:hypothetical protein
MERVERLLIDYQARHSQYQIDNFIIGKAGDGWARYQQALHEIDDRYRGLVEKRESLEIHELSRPKRIRGFGRKARRLRELSEIRHERVAEFALRDIRDTERELNRLVELAEALRSRWGRDELTPSKRAALDAESWRIKAIRMAALDIFVSGRISRASAELIGALPDNDRKQVLEKIAPESSPDIHGMIGLCASQRG